MFNFSKYIVYTINHLEFEKKTNIFGLELNRAFLWIRIQYTFTRYESALINNQGNLTEEKKKQHFSKL